MLPLMARMPARSARSGNGLRQACGLARRLRFRRCGRLSSRLLRVNRRTSQCTHRLRAVAKRPFGRRWLAATAGLALGLAAALPAKAQDTIKVGILHSLSGTMAISETTLKDVDAHADRRAEQEGRPARQEARGCRGRPGLELAAVRGKGARAHHQGQGRRSCSAAGPRCRASRCLPVFKELDSILFYPGAIRRRGERAQRVLYRRRAQPAGDPGRRLSDVEGRRRGQALGAGRHRLRLSAHHQQDPRSLSQAEGRRGRGYHDQLHAVRTLRLADHRCRHQEVRLGRQEDRGRLDHQRRRQRAVLQGTRQPGRQGRPTFPWSPSRSARKNSPASTPSRCSDTWRPGTTSSPSRRRSTTSSSPTGRPSSRIRSASPTIRWKPMSSASPCG